MRRIVCDECRKAYDFDRYEFCPRCGAFNQPVKTWSTDTQGNIVRVDGLNEQGHAGSFVHREAHKEKHVRRAAGLDWSGKKQGKAQPPSPPPPPRQIPAQPSSPPQRSRSAGKQNAAAQFKVIFWIIAAILFFNLIVPILFALL